MKIYKFWATEKQKILIDGQEKIVTCFGGSNLSLEDARARAQEKAGKIQRKIEGEQHVFDEYQVEIREELIETINEQALVTRNRYGASVLNVENLMILDIDKPRRNLLDVFKKKDPADDKAKIFEMVRKVASGSKYSALTFRLYETFQGARVIVMGQPFDPRSSDTLKMMAEFNTDRLYALLCQKQGCFRARLTPKPHRIKMRRFTSKFPRESNDSELQNWVKDYEQTSREFSVCKFIEQIGASRSLDEVLSYHDDVTGSVSPLRLA